MRSGKTFSAKADGASPLLPYSPIEINELTDPKDAVYLPDGRIATIQGNEVIFYLPNGSNTAVGGFTSLKQIKLFNERYVIVSDSGALRTIDLIDYTRNDLKYDVDGTPSTIGGNYFDLNGEYLITAYGSDLTVYALEEVITLYKSFSGVKGDYPIALNENGKVFYHSNATPQEFRTSDINDLDTSTVVKVGETVIQVANVITDRTNFYFLYEGDVYRGNNGDNKTTKLTVNSSGDFDLGKLVSPVGISFKNGNLLITDDGIDAVQEFKIEGDKLVFTGFAVAKGKTAFNRVINPSTVRNSKNAVAVIDGNRLTVIKNADGNLYDINNFYNYTNDFAPDALALGNTCALVVKKSESKLRLINYVDGTVSDVKTIDKNIITDVSYSNGYFYVSRIMNGSTVGTIILTLETIDEKIGFSSQRSILTATTEEKLDNMLISADVYGNVCLYNGGYFYRADNTENGYSVGEPLNQTTINGVKSLSNDLGGNIFFLTEDGVFYLDKNGEKKAALEQTAISFTLSFDQKTAYLLKAGEERIYKTDGLFNLSADYIPIADGLIFSGETADIENFKTYSLTASATPFIVKYENGALKCETVGTDVNDYVLIRTFNYSTCEDLSIDLAVLIGYDANSKPLLIAVKRENSLTETTSIAAEQTKLYVSTDVNLYYIPLITENDACCVKDGDGVLRITAGTEINATHKITDFNGVFYYAAITKSNGDTVYGYIPEKFTVAELPERVYSSTTLSEIKGDKGNALRNSLIVIALAASVFGTSLFFILKKSRG